MEIAASATTRPALRPSDLARASPSRWSFAEHCDATWE